MPTPGDAPEGFDAPWQANAYGLSQALIEAGHVSADQWANTMNGALRRKLHDEGLPDNVETYSLAVVEALGETMQSNDIVSADDVQQRAEAWRAAYKRTPHGKPVNLTQG